MAKTTKLLDSFFLLVFKNVLQIRNFLEWPVKQLQGYLSVRGLNTSERHVELVARYFSAMELKLPFIQSEEEERLQSQKNYFDKCDLLELPFGTKYRGSYKTAPVGYWTYFFLHFKKQRIQHRLY